MVLLLCNEIEQFFEFDHLISEIGFPSGNPEQTPDFLRGF